MFNIPIRKERGIRAKDFVVPKLHDESNPKMLYVVTEDVMRNGEYFMAIEVMNGKTTQSEDLSDAWKQTRFRMFKREEWKIEREYVNYFFNFMDEDLRERWQFSFPNSIQVINWYYRKILPKYMDDEIYHERDLWSEIRSAHNED